MMKRLICAALALFLLLAGGLAEGGQYEADAWLDFSLRREASANSYRELAIKEKQQVTVLEYGDEWCKISRKGTVGYCKTAWICRFRSLDPYTYQVPGYQRQAGLGRVVGRFEASVADYEGNAFVPGDLVTVQSLSGAAATLAMMRATVDINALNLDYTPFPAWDEAAQGDILYAFTTYYNEFSGKKLTEARQYNIELACQRINGTVLDSGATFSFNALCGPYKKSNGYQKAPNISAEGVGYGGGVCQVTTTLYNCVLGLPLQVQEWAVHRDRGVAYIPQHFDAAVGSYSDFSFTNTLPYQIIVEALPQNGVLTVLIRAGAGAAATASFDVADQPASTAEPLPTLWACDPDAKALYLLETADMDAAQVVELPAGLPVTVLAQSEDWAQVKAGNFTGFVSARCLYDENAPTAAKCTVSLRMRPAPDADAASFYTISKGEAVDVLTQGLDWAFVRYGEHQGFVQAKYLK